MQETVDSLFGQLVYLFTHLTLADVLDMAVVAAILFVLFQALSQRRSLQLLRGAIMFAVLGLVLLVLLPLNTVNWLLRGVLIAGAIALPLLFYEDLRQALTGLGQLGGWGKGSAGAYATTKMAIVDACTALSARREGALIVLEGRTPLTEIIETGVAVQAGAITSELLESIFYPKTPLHDGAVVLRGGQLVAASCILPVQTAATGKTHLGTRHRAALGLSAQVPDALVVVVSEETGLISVAREGRLHRGLSGDELDRRLGRFLGSASSDRSTGWRRFSETVGSWLQGTSLRGTISNLALAVVLAIIAWVAVVYQTNPPHEVTVTEVPLNVQPPDQGLVLMQEPPDSVSVQVQTTLDRAGLLDADSIRAEADLATLADGVHRVGINLSLADERAQLVSVSPAFIDVTLEPRATLTLTPTVSTTGVDSLPRGYKLESVSLSPPTVSAQGPRSMVEQVAMAMGELPLGGRRTGFQQVLPLTLVDGNGDRLSGISLAPDSVLATVAITRTFDTIRVAIQPTIEAGSLDSGYQVTSVRLSPAEVTLVGQSETLEQIGDFLATAPIGLGGVRDTLAADVPLVIPDGVSVLDVNGETVTHVLARVAVAPGSGYLALSKSPTLLGVPAAYVARLVPGSLTVLVVGPQPLLAEVEEEPGLVRPFLNLVGYGLGMHEVPVEVAAPGDLRIELFPSEIQVTLSPSSESEQEPGRELE
jgi:diadenylate cyclase